MEKLDGLNLDNVIEKNSKREILRDIFQSSRKKI
jgi:hypothetical protein